MESYRQILKTYPKVFFAFFILLVAHILLTEGSPFYETGSYISYVKSFLQDFDFNIVNQVPSPQNWLLTKTYHHPNQHPETQSPFILFFYLIEVIASFFISFDSYQLFKFVPSTLFMNFVCIWLGMKILTSKLDHDTDKVKASHFFIFISGQAFSIFHILSPPLSKPFPFHSSAIF